MASPDTHHSERTGEGKAYRLFGLNVTTEYPLLNCSAAAAGKSDLHITYSESVVDLESWGPVPAAYTSTLYTAGGEPLFRIYQREDCTRLHCTDVADFFVWPDRIECYRLQGSDTDLIEIRLLGMVLSLWLEHQGLPALHASAVSVTDRAAAFMATNSGGKTTLAAALMQLGYPLVSDDVLAVESCHDVFMAHPSYPQMRMAPVQADHFLGGHKQLDLVHQADSKRRVPVGNQGFGSFCFETPPLACLYLPERHAGGGIHIQPVSPSEAVFELVRHSFLARIVSALGLQPGRIASLSRMAETIPIRRLIYAEGFDNLPQVSAAIVEDLAAL